MNDTTARFTPEDPWAHVDAGHSLEYGNRSDYCRTCRMTIARHYVFGPQGNRQRGVSPLGYLPHDGGMVAAWAL